MKIGNVKLLHGPNRWSIQQKSVVVINLQEDKTSEEQLRRAITRAMQLMPDLAEKRHFRKEKGKVPDLINSIALELQCKAGMSCAYSKWEEGSQPGEYELVFSYVIEKAGLYAAKAAVKIAEALLQSEKCNIQSHINKLIRIKSGYSTGPTTLYILNEVINRGIPYRQFDNGSLITLGYGCRQRKMRTAVADTTSGLGIELAGDKEETKKILCEANLPIPLGIVVYSEDELRKRINEVKFPLVIKPLDGNHGRGVTTDINTLERAVFGFAVARNISNAVIVEEFIKGEDYRFLIINYKLIAVAKRTPAFIKGDGSSTIQELVTKENDHPDRGDTEDHVLAQIKIDAITQKILLEKKLTLDSILAQGEVLTLKDTANISAGGTATDVTDQVHPENVFLAERVARMFNLNICGLDIVATSVDVPLTREIGAIIEVNAGPGLRMHSNPQEGKARNVARPILDMLFPEPSAARIPVIAVSESSGSALICSLVAHIAKQAGSTPGYCSTAGIFIDGHLTYEGNCSGYQSAMDVLFEPTIDIAILECGTWGIKNKGLAYDRCDIGVIAGMRKKDADWNTVVAKCIQDKGYAVLNADDDRCYAVKDEAYCKIALFSTDKYNDRIRLHCSEGGVGASIEKEVIVFYVGNTTVEIVSLSEIPWIRTEHQQEIIHSVLAAVLTTSLSGVGSGEVRAGLLSFWPSPVLTENKLM